MRVKPNTRLTDVQTDSWKWTCHLLICFHSPPAGRSSSRPSVSVATAHSPVTCQSRGQMVGRAPSLSLSLNQVILTKVQEHTTPLSLNQSPMQTSESESNPFLSCSTFPSPLSSRGCERHRLSTSSWIWSRSPRVMLHVLPHSFVGSAWCFSHLPPSETCASQWILFLFYYWTHRRMKLVHKLTL